MMYGHFYPSNCNNTELKMGNEMSKNSIELDYQLVRNLRLREMDKNYSIHSNIKSLTNDEWSALHLTRRCLLHRIICVSSNLGLKRETCHLASFYLTKILLLNLLKYGHVYPLYMSNKKTPTHPNILILTVLLVIASKIEEVNPPSIYDILNIVQNEFGVENNKINKKNKKKNNFSIYTTKDDIIKEEKNILKLLEWKLYPATSITWILILLEGIEFYDFKIQNSPSYVDSHGIDNYDIKKNENENQRLHFFYLICNLLDISSLDSNSLYFLPSILAASALFLIKPGLNLYFLSNYLQLKPQDIWECITWLQQFMLYQNIPIPISIHSTMLTKLNKIPNEDRYSIQVNSTINLNSIIPLDDLKYEPECERDIILPPLSQYISPINYTTNNFGSFS